MKVRRSPLARAADSPQAGCLVSAGIIAAGLIAAALIINGALRGIGNVVEETSPPRVLASVFPPATATVLVRPAAITQVRALSDLTTASTTLSTIAEAQQARVGNILYERLILLACGRVKAGIDLAKLRDDDVRVSADGRKVTIRLPRAEIFDTYLIDDTSQPCYTRVYDRTNLILLPSSKDLESQARDQAVKAMRDTAVQAGVLADADRNARIVIERVLKAAGYESVDFIER